MKTVKFKELPETVEPTKVEPEFKAGDEVEYSDAVDDDGNDIWENEIATFTGGFKSNGRPIIEIGLGISTCTKIRKVQPTKTQEEMDREWRRQAIYNQVGNADCLDELLEKAINYGRNTKKN